MLSNFWSELRGDLGEAPWKRGHGRQARTRLFAQPLMPPGVRLAPPLGGGARNHHRSIGQNSTEFPSIPGPDELSITISVVEGPSKGLVYKMKKHCITVGRTGGGADFQFNEPEASEIQCIVATRQNGVCLYDAVSIHGTYVNNQRIAAAELTDMSTFQVGSSRLLIEIHPNQAADID